jgi:hypothetical protein
MIDPETGQMGFRIGLFIVLMAFGCLFIVEPGSAAYYVDIITLVIGLIFIGILVVLIRKKM